MVQYLLRRQKEEKMTEKETYRNPIIYSDFPDPDVIRVGNLYYMVSTTMHMFPGGDILVSEDLCNWKLLCHIYDVLDETPAQKLEEGNIYSKGMWAASLRYHDGLFHIFFVCNDTHSDYHYVAENPAGPWKRKPIEGKFFHDCSVLFDDDGRVYVAYGNREIHITEMEPDLSKPREGGLDRIALRDSDEAMLGYEGTHLYKLNGKYYMFFIHWMKTGTKRRTEACFVADSIDGEFNGRDILDDDMGFHNLGVAQGAIVDSPDGRWFAVLFQDHGACGRMPVLMPMRWENDFPVIDGVPAELENPFKKKAGDALSGEYQNAAPLWSSDSLTDSSSLKPFWQWNHQPDNSKWSLSDCGLRLASASVADNVEKARNTLTQRTFGPRSCYEVSVDATSLKDGDRAGLCALQGLFAELCVSRNGDGFSIGLMGREGSEGALDLKEMSQVSWDRLRLRAEFDFDDLKDTVSFFVIIGDRRIQVGEPHKLVYRLDHFMGVRIGLFCYSTKTTGGSALFKDFTIEK